MIFRNFLNFEFRKRLPSEFGGGRIYVTGRADARVLKFGWKGAAFDLQIVTRNIIGRDMCVWDIGANQGILSFLAASKVGPSGSVYALEADPHYADLIHRSSARLPAAYQPVNVLCAAISDQPGVLEFGVSAKGHARNKLLTEGDNFEVEAVKAVPAITGDALLDVWNAPHFVKMDVEGAEFAALSGSRRILAEVRPIFYLEVSQENVDKVSEILREFDYDIFHLKGDGQEQPIDTCSFYTIARPRVI